MLSTNKRISFMVVFVLCFLLLSHFTPEKNRAIRIMSFNVAANTNAPTVQQYNDWNERKADITQIITDSSADLLCLQGIPQDDNLEYMTTKSSQLSLSPNACSSSCPSTAILFNPKKLTLKDMQYSNDIIPISMYHFYNRSNVSFMLLNVFISSDIEWSDNILEKLNSTISAIDIRNSVICLSVENPNNITSSLIESLQRIKIYSTYADIRDANNKSFYTYMNNKYPVIFDYIFSNIDIHRAQPITILRRGDHLPSKERKLPSTHIPIVTDFPY